MPTLALALALLYDGLMSAAIEGVVGVFVSNRLALPTLRINKI